MPRAIASLARTHGRVVRCLDRPVNGELVRESGIASAAKAAERVVAGVCERFVSASVASSGPRGDLQLEPEPEPGSVGGGANPRRSVFSVIVRGTVNCRR